MSNKTVNQQIQEYLNEKQLDLENRFKKILADTVEEYGNKYSSEINTLRKAAKFAEDYGDFQLMEIIRSGGQVLPIDPFTVTYPESQLRLEVEGGRDILQHNRSACILKRGRYRLTILIEKLKDSQGG